MVDSIVAVLSGTLDQGGEWWVPNKGVYMTINVLVSHHPVEGEYRYVADWFGDISEQYIETKSHWLPDFPVTRKEGVMERHQRGPLKEQKY